MGTRGFVGFVIDGEEKLAYNQFDSYPGGVGINVLEWLRTVAPARDALAAAVRNLRVVDEERDGRPTPTDIEKLGTKYGDPTVAGNANTDITNTEIVNWYQLLRGTQGSPGAMLDAGVIEDASGFPFDSLFCEWGYLIDLDDGVFQVYEGFQKEDHDKGRFAQRGEGGDYRPVALVGSWPLDALPSDEEFFAIEAQDEEDA